MPVISPGKHRERHVVDHAAHADVLDPQDRQGGGRPRAGRLAGCRSFSSSPIMCWIRRARSNSAAGPVTMMRPLRSTEMRSACVSASSSACEMKIIATPRFCSDFIRSNRCSVSSGVSAAVGSSRMMTRASLSTARAISTICRLAADSEPASCDGIDVEVQPLQHLPGGIADLAHRIERALAAEHHVLGHGQLRHQAGFLVDHGDAEAAGILRRGEVDRLRHRCCSTPSDGATTPAISLQSVDLPAPFSPARAWISPG